MCKTFLYYNVVLLVENLKERTGHRALSIRNQFGVGVGGSLESGGFQMFPETLYFHYEFPFLGTRRFVHNE